MLSFFIYYPSSGCSPSCPDSAPNGRSSSFWIPSYFYSHFHLHRPPRPFILIDLFDPAPDLGVLAQQVADRAVVASGYVAQFAAFIVDAHCKAVVRVVRFRGQGQRVAGTQAVEQGRAVMVLKPGDGETVQEKGWRCDHACCLVGFRQGQQGQGEYGLEELAAVHEKAPLFRGEAKRLR
jgi:hypothetical protein